MRHFVAYHNTEKMGRPLHDSEPLRLLARKAVAHLLGNTVWLVTGEGAGPRRYSLGSVFLVTEVGDTSEAGFRHFASGPGHVFRPAVPIEDMPWFPDLLRTTAHFSLGVREVKDEAILLTLVQLAAEAGYQVE